MIRAQADPGGRTVDLSIERVQWTCVGFTHGRGRYDRHARRRPVSRDGARLPALAPGGAPGILLTAI
ncbi:MAG: hypothetical protein OYK82_06435 [Gammaproteobacteria bacterium]|nr:hypothetical protein [Gammaproteobacteria bacterium]